MAPFFSFAVLGSQHGQCVVTNEGVLWVGERGAVLQLPHQRFGTVSNEIGVEMATVLDGFVLVKVVVGVGGGGEGGLSGDVCRAGVGKREGEGANMEQQRVSHNKEKKCFELTKSNSDMVLWVVGWECWFW